jgi:Kef-type K+ transport system membrane component KefB
MTHVVAATVVAAGVWGALWALFLQKHTFGQWLAMRRTWLTVVVGIGVDLLLLIAVLDWQAWVTVIAVIAASSVGILIRSWINEHREDVQ